MPDTKKLLSYLGEGIEEIILIGIIILNILDFAEMLSPDWDYAKKILSWTALGYLLYKSSPTGIFFGETNRRIDGALIITYFLFSAKIFIGYAQSTINSFREKGFSYWGQLFSVEKLSSKAQIINLKYPVQSLNLTSPERIQVTSGISNNLSNMVDNLTILTQLPPQTNNLLINLSNNVSSSLLQVETKYSIHRWLNLVSNNPQAIYHFSMLLGGIMLILLALYCASRQDIKKPSMMAIFYGERQPPRGKEIILRFLAVFLVMNFFFIAIFNLAIEWLAIAVDAPILVMGLFFYLLVWIKHHHKFSSEGFIYRVGNFGTDFYQKFMSLLKSKNGILLGVAGMLVLHLLTDVGIFMIPYSTGLENSLYFEQLQGSHQPLFSVGDYFTGETRGLVIQDFLHMETTTDKLFLLYNYIANHLSLLLILVIPAVLWYIIFRKKELQAPIWFPAVFFSSFVCLLMNPAYIITRVNSYSMIGVDIKTQSLMQTASFSFASVFLLSVLTGIILLALSLNKNLRKYLTLAGVIVILVYFANYIFLYFIDTIIYYLQLISYNIQQQHLMVGFFFIVFMLITIFFYTGGFISYLYELVRS